MKQLVVLAALILAACGALEPRPDPTRFYVLTPATDGTSAASARFAPVAIGLGPVTLPSYLARTDIATRVGPHQIEYNPVARWAEPLQTNLVRVLAHDLEQTLGPGTVVIFPWFGAARLQYVVEVDVQRFETDGTGTATLAAEWAIRDAATRTLLAGDDTQVSEPAASPDTAGSVAALSRALAVLGNELAAGLQKARGTPPPSPRNRRQSSRAAPG
jgi:uncharacterized lipoprotein YmbA